MDNLFSDYTGLEGLVTAKDLDAYLKAAGPLRLHPEAHQSEADS